MLQVDVPPSIEDASVYGPISDALLELGFTPGKPEISNTETS